MFENEVLAILAAAIENDNANARNGTLTPSNRPTMLDYAIDEYLFHEVPKTEIKRPRIAPQLAVKAIARASTVATWATAEVLGHDLTEANPHAVAERIRVIQRNLLAGGDSAL